MLGYQDVYNHYLLGQSQDSAPRFVITAMFNFSSSFLTNDSPERNAILAIWRLRASETARAHLASNFSMPVLDALAPVLSNFSRILLSSSLTLVHDLFPLSDLNSSIPRAFFRGIVTYSYNLLATLLHIENQSLV